MEKKLIGKKHFEGIVDITDPCYNKSIWCRAAAPVKRGEYDCVIWKVDDDVYDVVGIVGIYLNGVVPKQSAMEKIGTIGVDAGLAGFFMNKPDYDDEQWSYICSLAVSKDAWFVDEGFCSTSGYGDGTYDVYAYRDGKNITALEIRFI